MSRLAPLDFGGRFYRDAAKPYSQQDVCNYLVASAERPGTRSPKKLETPPGLYPLAQADVSGYAPGRGVHDAEGRLFAVMGRTLYETTQAGVLIPQGTIPGVGRVRMSHNQIAGGGNQLTAVNGSAGYVYNTRTLTFGRITDPGFPGSRTTSFLSGYTIVIDPQGGFAQSSAPADSTAWNTLDRFTSEVSPDNLVTQGVRGGSELLLLSSSTGEFFQATPNVRQPIRSKKISFNKGASGPYGLVEADGNIFWHGNDGPFYCLNNYREKRISTRAIERSIIGLDWSRAVAYLWEDAGHCVIYWCFPGGLTWGYDVAEDEWHRRDSLGMLGWRVNDTTRWGNRWVACDAQQPRLWLLDWDYPWEGEEAFVSRFTMPVIHDDQNPVIVERLELVMDTGMPVVEAVAFSAQPDPPTISGDPPTGYTGTPYEFAFTLGGGTPPYRVTLREGTLHTGFDMPFSGVIEGTTEVAAERVITVRVTDATGLWAEHETTLQILPAIEYILLMHLATDTVDEMGQTWNGGTLAATPTLFGQGSRRINGHLANILTTHDYVAALNSAGDWTIGLFVYRDSAPLMSSDILLGHWYAAATRSLNWASLRSDDLLRLFLSSDGTAFTEIVSTDILPYDQWSYVEICKEDGVVYQSIDGQPNGSAAFAGDLHTNVSLGLNWLLGGNDSTYSIDPSQGLQGWVREFVMIDGSLGRAGIPFTPPTAPWPDPPP